MRPDETSLRPELIAFLNGWVQRKGIAPECPACRQSAWQHWRVYFLDTQMTNPVPHYARPCLNCGLAQIFDAEIVFPFVWSQALAMNAEELLDARLGPTTA